MPVSEIQRTDLINSLVEVLGEERTETLMQCILPEGRDQLATKDDLKRLELATKDDLKRLEFATKDDLKALEITLRGEFRDEFAQLRIEFAEFKSEIRTEMAKQTRYFTFMLIGFMITIWATMIPIALAT
ncbi:MAG: hypothetical protein OXF00_07710 [bacterium]|nr:hypothetical protein [bacterium]